MSKHLLFRRLATTAISAACALLLTAQVAFAGGSGVIRYPNPSAPVVPGITERAFLAEKCAKVPAERQGFDAWVAELDPSSKYLTMSTSDLPEAPIGYTFHVAFYSYDEKYNGCGWRRYAGPLKNPTPPLWTNGAEWAVISLMAGVEVEVQWKQCETSFNCSI